MNRINIAKRGIGSWRSRLKNPTRQWVRIFSAFETAISWELANRNGSGIPIPIRELLEKCYDNPELLLGIAEHKVPLPSGNADSQSDVWALIKTQQDIMSLTVEAKAREPFSGAALNVWLKAGKSEQAHRNRAARWDFIRSNLPQTISSYGDVEYQLLHRCASAVIEARRYGLSHAAFIVQAFATPANRFQEFQMFC